MKIVFDARMITGERHGIARYAEEVLKYIKKSGSEHEFVLLVNSDKKGEITGGFEHFETDVPMYSLKEQKIIPQVLKEIGAELYYLPSYNAPVESPCPAIFTIYDLIHLRYPEGFFKGIRNSVYYSRYVAPAARNAAAVVTISETSRRDIVELLKTPAEKIHVSGVGISDLFFETGKKENILPKGRPYLMTVSNPKKHKDTITLVHAFEKIISAGQWDGDLVLVGGQSGEVEAACSRIGERARIIKGINDAELADMMKCAALFVFTSLYEGFGLPPAEAMACGTPVVSSDCPALKEALGNAARFYPAKKFEALSDNIMKVLSDGSLRAEMVKNGLEQSKQYTWNRVGAAVSALFDKYQN